jgi:hypothetical protein
MGTDGKRVEVKNLSGHEGLIGRPSTAIPVLRYRNNLLTHNVLYIGTGIFYVLLRYGNKLLTPNLWKYSASSQEIGRFYTLPDLGI